MNMSAQLYGNALHPVSGSSWGMRLQIAFLFPKLPPEMKEKLEATGTEEVDEPEIPPVHLLSLDLASY